MHLVTNNASNSKAAGALLNERYSNIYWSSLNFFKISGCRLVRKCPPDLHLKLMMKVPRVFFKITRANIMMYNNQSEIFERFLYDGECWCVLIQKKRVLCSIFKSSNKDDIDKVANLTMGDLRGTNFLLQIYSTVKR